ncbi:MAG TPA: hypothetical protein VEL51_01185 [Vicinamibacterales bacterium]|nr:hypothetical protein [Vicinamibacterales bacterium]
MATDRKKVPSGQSLRRALGRTSATFLTAAMIIGTGLFAALGATTEKAGSGLPLAMIFSGLVALATGLSAASVGIGLAGRLLAWLGLAWQAAWRCLRHCRPGPF